MKFQIVNLRVGGKLLLKWLGTLRLGRGLLSRGVPLICFRVKVV